MNIKYFLFILSGLFAFSACDLEQEVDIELPEFEQAIALECYLEPGKPFRLLMTQADPFFAPLPALDEQFLSMLLVDSAEVTITYEGETIALRNQFSLDPGQIKFFNYVANEIVPEAYGTSFELNVVTKEGETIFASTTLLEPVPIDSVVIEPDDEIRNDTLFYRALTYFTDRPNEANFYRRMLHVSSLDSLPEQDFVTDDRIVEDRVVFGSSYEFIAGDTIINTLFHIDENYYNYLESAQNAISGNFNPFGQPSPIISNLEGSAKAIGVFTGLTYDRITKIVPE